MKNIVFVTNHASQPKNQHARASGKYSKILTIIMLAMLSLPGFVNGLRMPTSAAAAITTAIFLTSTFIARPGWLRTIRISKIMFIPLAVILFIFAFNLLRGIFSNYFEVQEASKSLILFVFMQALLGASIFIVFANHPTTTSYLGLMRSLYFALLFVALMQVGLLFLGITHAQSELMPPTRSPNATLALLGIDYLRVALPIGTGLNHTAIYSAVLVSMAIFRISFDGVKTGVIGLTLGLITLALVDSRAAIVAPFFALVVVLAFRRSYALICLIAILLPLIFISILLLENILPEGVNDIIMFRYDTFGGFSGRAYIWEVAAGITSELSFWKIMFGNGVYSQVTSGAGIEYRNLFEVYGNSAQTTASLHNVYIQLFLDAGLTGLIAYVLVLSLSVFFLCKLLHSYVSELTQALATIIVLCLLSASEVATLPYSREGYTIFLIVVVLPVFLYAASHYENHSGEVIGRMPKGAKRTFGDTNSEENTA